MWASVPVTEPLWKVRISENMKNHILLSQPKVKYGSLKMRFPGEK